jgi:hypothetical protein
MAVNFNLDELDIIDFTVSEARKLIDVIPDHELTDQLTSALDKAQGAVHSGKSEEEFVIIRITP